MIQRLLLILIVAHFGPFHPGPSAAQDLFIDNARMVGAGEGSELVQIAVRDGRISDIGVTAIPVEGAERLDAAGNYVTPALMNSMTQLGLIELFSVNETRDSTPGTAELGAAFDVQYALNENSILADIARHEGLGWAVTLPDGGDGGFEGLGAILHLRVDGSLLYRPRAGLVFKSGQAANGSRAASWTKLHKALEAGSDADAPVAEMLAGDIPLVIKASRESDIVQALAIRAKYGVRVILIGGEEAWRQAPELAAADIPVILVPYASLPSNFDMIGARADNAALLHKAGVKIAFCTDSIFISHNAGNMMRIGAGIAAGHGLDRDAALDAMTRNPAEIWGLSADYGALEPGKSADIVIWSGDPLEVLSRPIEVVLGGQIIDTKSRHQALRDAYHPDN
jgi:imidazolonepropionase-like amidohydrolase